MNLRTTLAFFFAVIVSSSCFAQQAQQYPACLLNPIEEYESGSLLTEINGTIRDYWFVYSSQADNKGYTNSDLSQVFKNYNFLDCFYVLEEQSDLLLVLEYGWVKYGQLAEGWQEHSCWFPKSALLLWRNCLIDPNSNANDPKINLPRKKTYYINRKIQEAAYNQGFFSKSKQDKQFKLEAPQNLSSYFVYKIQGEWVLLGKTPEIDDIKNASEYIPGWVHSENLIEWNGFDANFEGGRVFVELVIVMIQADEMWVFVNQIVL